MGTPSRDDPLGQRPDPGSFADALTTVVDERIKMHLRGRTSRSFDGTRDMDLVQELLARGWAVFRPNSQD